MVQAAVLDGLVFDVDLSRICAAPSACLGHLTFEGQGAFASQCWMPTARIIEAVDVLEDGGFGLATSNIDLRWGCDVGFRLCIPLPDGTTLDPEQLRFEALAEAFGLSPGDFGREFSTGRDKFKVTGIDPRRPKYPVSAERLPDRQGFKFTAEQVALLLQAGMRDITPKR